MASRPPEGEWRPEWRESARQLEERLRREGRWDEFKRRRKELAQEMGGLSKEVRLRAAEEFPSLDAKPMQEDDGGTERLERKRPRAEPGDRGFRVSVPPVAEWPEHWRGKPAKPRASDIEWVLHNVVHPDPRPEDCPSPFAWGLLEFAKHSLFNYGFVVQNLLVRLLPSKAEVDRNADRARRDRDVEEALSALGWDESADGEAAVGVASAQGVGGEPGVPEASDESRE